MWWWPLLNCFCLCPLIISCSLNPKLPRQGVSRSSMPCLPGNVCRARQEGQAAKGSRSPLCHCSTHRAVFWVPREVSGWSLPFFPDHLLSWKVLGGIKSAQFSQLWCPFGFYCCLPVLKESIFLDVSLYWRIFFLIFERTRRCKPSLSTLGSGIHPVSSPYCWTTVCFGVVGIILCMVE